GLAKGHAGAGVLRLRGGLVAAGGALLEAAAGQPDVSETVFGADEGGAGEGVHRGGVLPDHQGDGRAGGGGGEVPGRAVSGGPEGRPGTAAAEPGLAARAPDEAAEVPAGAGGGQEGGEVRPGGTEVKRGHSAAVEGAVVGLAAGGARPIIH